MIIMGTAASHDEKADDTTSVLYDIHNNGSVHVVVTVTDDSMSHHENGSRELEETGRELIEEYHGIQRFVYRQGSFSQLRTTKTAF